MGKASDSESGGTKLDSWAGQIILGRLLDDGGITLVVLVNLENALAMLTHAFRTRV